MKQIIKWLIRYYYNLNRERWKRIKKVEKKLEESSN